MSYDIVERLRVDGGHPDLAHPLCVEAADEIERLREWKAEATVVLGRWTAAWVAAGRPGALGESIAKATADEIERLQAIGDRMADAATRQQWSTLDVAAADWLVARRGDR